MRTKLATYALAGALGLTSAALVVPAVSYAATGSATEGMRSIKTVLSGLVSDGTLTQAQADKVATVIAEARPARPGPGGHGRHGGGHRLDLAPAATALGLSEAELRTQLQAGRTLADIADEQDVPQADLVAALVKAGKARLAQAVNDGRLTQAEADDKAAGLEARITERLDEPLRRGGHHGGMPAPGGTTAPSGSDGTA